MINWLAKLLASLLEKFSAKFSFGFGLKKFLAKFPFVEQYSQLSCDDVESMALSYSTKFSAKFSLGFGLEKFLAKFSLEIKANSNSFTLYRFVFCFYFILLASFSTIHEADLSPTRD